MRRPLRAPTVYVRSPNACARDPRLAWQLVGDPVDVVTGDYTEVVRELLLPGPLPLDFRRHYSSALSKRPGGLGLGHSHSLDHRLVVDIDGLRYEPPMGPAIGFPPLLTDETSVVRDGWRLLRRTARAYRLATAGLPAMDFNFADFVREAPLEAFTSGQARIELLYSPAGVLEGIVDSAGRRLRCAVDEQGRLVEVVLSADDRPERSLLAFRYDPEGHLSEGTDAYGSRFAFAYDKQGRLVRRTERSGFAFTFSYDSKGRCVHARGEDGYAEVRLRYEADAVTIVRKADGGEWTYLHPDGLLSKVIDPYGGVTTLLRDDAGRLSKELDPLGNATTYVYDAIGACIATRSPLGDYVPMEHADTDPRSHPVPSCPAEYELGRFLNFRAIELPVDSGTALGPLLQEEREALYCRSSAAQHRMLTDELGKLVGEEDVEGRRRRYVYDAAGALHRYTDFDGGTWTFEHASWSQRVAEVDPLGQRVCFEYTDSGRLAKVVDSGNTETCYFHDLNDRIAEVHRHGALKESYRRDAAGSLIEKCDASGASLLMLENGPGKVVKTRHLSSGGSQQFEHDVLGRVTRIETPHGEVTFRYDPFGNRVADLRDGLGVEHEFRSRNLLIETTLLGRFRVRLQRKGDTLTIIDPGGRSHEIRRIGNGLVQRRLSNGSSEIAQYDASGRCRMKAARLRGEPRRPWIRTYKYSGEGDLLETADSARGSTRYEYDPAHRIAARTSPDGSRETFVYAAGNNLVRQPGLDARVKDGNRLERANGDLLSYDDRQSLASRRGTTSVRYHYDSRGMLVGCGEEDAAKAAWTAEYDGFGRRIAKTWRGERTDFYWDTDRLAAEVGPDRRLRTYIYADSFALVPILVIDYDSIEADPVSGKRAFPFTDQLGAPLLVEDEGGRTIWSASYEPYGAARITPGNALDVHLRLPGHYADPEIGLHYNRFRSYSPELGRYLQSDPSGIAGGINLYAYPASPLTHVDVRGLNSDVCEIPPKKPNEEDASDEEGDGKARSPTPEELDEAFGKKVDPKAVKPHEIDADGNIITNPDLQEVKPGQPPNLDPNKQWLWLVDADGRLLVGAETPCPAAQQPGDDYMPKLGHPTLVGGTAENPNQARMGGEIKPNPDGSWSLNNNSGRFSEHPDRGPEQLNNVNDRFKESGLNMGEPKDNPARRNPK